MPIVLALFLTPVAFFTARAAESFKSSKKKAICLNCLLVMITIVFYVFVFLTRLAPFDFEIEYSKEFMFFSGYYWGYLLVIYVFSPFMWVITVHFAKPVLRALRVKKNAVIKRDNDFLYYRDDMDKIAPGIIMFTSEMSVDMRRSIASGILKLKLSGYVKENGGHYICTDKTTQQLFASEKMLLRLIKTKSFDAAAYRRALESEALEGKYVARNEGGAALKILRILLAVCIPVVLFVGYIRLVDYGYEHYNIYPEPTNDGYEVYIILDRSEDIEKLMNEFTDETHLHGTYSDIDGKMHYNSNWVKVNQFQYSVVRKAYLINAMGCLSMGISVLSVFFALHNITEQIRYFKKNYRRTAKGNVLLNKAYALKNYLKDYSLIKERSERELILWEYYLVYAVALEVNGRVEDEVMQKLIINEKII